MENGVSEGVIIPSTQHAQEVHHRDQDLRAPPGRREAEDHALGPPAADLHLRSHQGPVAANEIHEATSGELRHLPP
eukprot:11524642-Prorocentrum_lima.AAC.1